MNKFLIKISPHEFPSSFNRVAKGIIDLLIQYCWYGKGFMPRYRMSFHGFSLCLGCNWTGVSLLIKLMTLIGCEKYLLAIRDSRYWMAYDLVAYPQE